MDKTTSDLLQKLADKLGTTVNYLWAVLIKQSTVEFWTDIIIAAILLLSPIIIYRLHRFFDKRFTKDNYSHNYYDEPVPVIVMLCACIGTVVCIGLSIQLILDAVNAYYNPEYWALKQILGSIRG